MQYILLQTYTGLSTFCYEVTSTGRKLTLDEALAFGLTNRNELDRHKRSDYTAEWHEIKPGDQIMVELRDDETDESWKFIVPEAGLPKPPVSLDDERTGMWLHEYLREHCQCAE